MTNQQRYEELILGLKNEAAALSLGVTYYDSPGTFNPESTANNVHLYNNFTYEIIVKEFLFKINKRKTANALGERTIWYTNNL